MTEDIKIKNGQPYYEGRLVAFSDELPDNLVVDGDLNCMSESTKLPKGLMLICRVHKNYKNT